MATPRPHKRAAAHFPTLASQEEPYKAFANDKPKYERRVKEQVALLLG